jgi:hypothetical protein
VHDHPLKLNGTTTHTQLDAVKLSCFTSHVNSLVIFAFIDMRGTEHCPMFGIRDRRHYGKNKKHTKDPRELLFQHAVPPGCIPRSAAEASGDGVINIGSVGWGSLLTRRMAWQLDARKDARECEGTGIDSLSGKSATIDREPK